MGTASKTAKAAAKAVEKSRAVAKIERTPEQRMKDIEKNFAANLAVTPDDQKWLYAQFLDTSKDLTARYEEIQSALKLLNEYLTGRVYDSLDDALRNMLQAYVTMRDNEKEMVALMNMQTEQLGKQAALIHEYTILQEEVRRLREKVTSGDSFTSSAPIPEGVLIEKTITTEAEVYERLASEAKATPSVGEVMATPPAGYTGLGPVSESEFRDPRVPNFDEESA